MYAQIPDVPYSALYVIVSGARTQKYADSAYFGAPGIVQQSLKLVLHEDQQDYINPYLQALWKCNTHHACREQKPQRKQLTVGPPSTSTLNSQL